jgi:hypothetical protein
MQVSYYFLFTVLLCNTPGNSVPLLRELVPQKTEAGICFLTCSFCSYLVNIKSLEK